MRKADLIEKVANEFGVTKTTAEKMIEFINDSVVQELINDGDSVIHGVGVLKVRERSPRVCRNPKTGEMINVPAKKAIVFKASKHLKEKVQ